MGAIDWNDMAQDMNRLWALADAVMNLQVSENIEENFLTR